MEVRCPKCGMYQDPTAPTCQHMMGRKGGALGRREDRVAAGLASAAKRGPPKPGQMAALGRAGGAALRRTRGYNHFAEIGRRGGATRAKQKEEEVLAKLLGTDKEKP